MAYYTVSELRESKWLATYGLPIKKNGDLCVHPTLPTVPIQKTVRNNPETAEVENIDAAAGSYQGKPAQHSDSSCDTKKTVCDCGKVKAFKALHHRACVVLATTYCSLCYNCLNYPMLTLKGEAALGVWFGTMIHSHLDFFELLELPRRCANRHKRHETIRASDP